MNEDRASEIANELLDREGVDPASQEGAADLRAVSGSLQALVPDVDVWAVVELVVLPRGEETRLVILALRGEVLWHVKIERRNDLPVVTVQPHQAGAWRVLSVGDCVAPDGLGARNLRRGWVLALGNEFVSFVTEHLVLRTPEPDREERLGRALAEAQDWAVGDVPIEYPS